MTRIDSSMDWVELERIASSLGRQLTYRVARCEHGKTRQQTCVECEGGYVTDSHVFARIGKFGRLGGRALVAISDDMETVAYIPRIS